MPIKDIIAKLQQFDPDQEMIAQVVGAKEGAWNMQLSITQPANTKLVVITMSHPELEYLPPNCSKPVQFYQCKNGHNFLALPDHPVVLGMPLCPHCALKGGVKIQ